MTYPQVTETGETAWACCTSSIGPVCPHREPPRTIATGRDETEPCEAGTTGCCINHSVDPRGCETW